MQDLTIIDLTLGITDLLEKRTTLLDSCAAGKMYRPALEAKRQILNAIVRETSKSGKALATQLLEVDGNHDKLGIAIRTMVDAYLVSPATPSSVREALERISTGVVPSFGELKAPYSEEAVRAGVRREKLIQLETDLDSPLCQHSVRQNCSNLL